MSVLASDSDKRDEAQDKVFYAVADGVKMVFAVLAIVFCIVMFFSSVICTETEMNAIRSALWTAIN